MRTFALLLVSLLSCGVAAAAPSNTPTPHSVSTTGAPVRVSIINLSGARRQVRMKSGLMELPFAQLIDVNTQIGATVYVMSDSDRSLDERIIVKPGDDARILVVQ